MLAFLSAIAFGVTAGAIVGAIATGDPRYTMTWSIALPVALLAGIFSLFGGSIVARRRGAAPEAPPVGELALARVERISRTGLSVNGQPQVDLLLTVAPRFRSPYTTVHRQIVDIVAVPQVQPGAIIVVRRPDDAKANVELVLDPPEDWAGRRDAERLRTGTDRTVPLASEAPEWPSTPQSLLGGARAPAHPWRRVLLAGAFLIAATLVLIPAYDSIGRTVRAIAAGDPAAAGVVEGDRHAEIVDALAAETGGTTFVRIGFYDGYALAAAPSEPGALTIDSYQYRYDRTERQGPEPIQPTDPAAALFDVDEVDFTRLREHIATAKEHAGIADPDSVIVLVARSPVADDTGEQPVQVLVLLDADYADASVTIDPQTGRVVS
ncbi:hypothetical protein LQ757_03345 [Agromyces sp. SYSU K20354]|uniref:hypothetical protein n=1 Tax=Agromyces cavernae TaxID=2898659 RepID=UPI001E32C9F2|nr:hypothetical protein [Agromyces cavernae]MCD2441307.1 hypothetical protein [Agromyces cavernae]